jgi:hypothetical protein
MDLLCVDHAFNLSVDTAIPARDSALSVEFDTKVNSLKFARNFNFCRFVASIFSILLAYCAIA